MGSIEFEGNYNGDSFSKDVSYQNSIMTITLEDYENIFSQSEHNVIFKYSSACTISNDMCFNNFKGTTIWNLKSEDNCDENVVPRFCHYTCHYTNKQIIGSMI